MSADPGQPDMDAINALLRAELDERERWACACCMPSLRVDVSTADAQAQVTVTIAHSPGCSAAAQWLIRGTGAPPGYGAGPLSIELQRLIDQSYQPPPDDAAGTQTAGEPS